MEELTILQTGRSMAQILGGLLCGGIAIFTIVAVVMACIRRTRRWVVTSIIAAVVGFGLLAAAASFALRWSGREIKERSSARQTVLSDDGKVGLKIPPGWTQIPNLYRDAQLQFGNPQVWEYVAVLSSARSGSAGSFDQQAAAAVSALSQPLRKSEISAPEELTIAGFPARRTRLAGTLILTPVVYLHTAVGTPDRLYEIIQWTLASRETELFPLFEEVAASFELAGPETPPH